MPTKKGQPTKYCKKLYPKIEKLCKVGMIDKDIAFILGVTESTFSLWKATHKEFSEFLKESKVLTDKDMESSLRKRATGCTTKETKVVRRISRETGTMEDYEEVTIIKEHPPETKAIEKWLDNRNPDRWKNKVEVDNKISGEIGVRIIDDIK
jgi:hypothetical protein